MNILFYGFRHGHILSCYRALQKHPEYTILAALEEDEVARFEKLWKYANMMRTLLADEELDIWYRCEIEGKYYGKIYGVDMGKLERLGKNSVTGKSAANLCCYNYAENGEYTGADGVVLSVFNNEYDKSSLTKKNRDKNYLFYESLCFVVEVIDTYSCAFEG